MPTLASNPALLRFGLTLALAASAGIATAAVDAIARAVTRIRGSRVGEDGSRSLVFIYVVASNGIGQSGPVPAGRRQGYSRERDRKKDTPRGRRVLPAATAGHFFG